MMVGSLVASMTVLISSAGIDLLSCTTDADCGSESHCAARQRIVVKNRPRWEGLCAAGARPTEVPAPMATSSTTERFEYEGAVPAGYRLESRPDLRFLVPGAAVFGVSYVLSQLWLALLQWNASSLIPLAGPLTQFFTERGSLTPSNSGEFNLAVFGTVGQVLGAAAIVVGIAKPIRWLERSSLVVAPAPGGMAVLGTF